MRGLIVPLLVIGLVGAGGWHYREPLMQQVKALEARFKGEPADVVTERTGPEPRKDTIYRWVDENGVAHYEQQPVNGAQAVEIDQGRIQSLSQYQKPALDEHGNPIVEANGDGKSEKGLRAAQQFPQAQYVNP